MNKDILKGKWLEIKGRVKETLGKLTDNDLAEMRREKARNFWGFYRRNMDVLMTNPGWNIKIVSNWQKLSAVYVKIDKQRTILWQLHLLLATGDLCWPRTKKVK